MTTSVLKLLPLIAVIVIGLVVFGGGYEVPAEGIEQTPVSIGAIAGAAALALWAMLGFESATVPAERVRDPGRTIARATLVGTLLVGAIYLLVSITVLMLLPADEASASSAPLADLVARYWGAGAAGLVAAFAAISALGALNGWVLLQAEVPMVLAQRKVFPALFAQVNRSGMPVVGHLVGCSLSVVLIATNLSRGLVDIFAFVILLATVANLALYFTAALAILRLLRRGEARGALLAAAAAVGALFALWTFYGAGLEAVAWGVVLLGSGIPIYFLMRWRAGSSQVAEASPAAPRGSSV